MLKQESELREGVKRADSAADATQSDSLKEQLRAASVRKESLLQQIQSMDQDIMNKEKQLKKAK